MKSQLLGLVAALGLLSVPHMASAAVSMAGDDDCFGFGGACPDGTRWRDDLGGVFFTSNQGPGDAPFTDTWNSFVDPSFDLANPGGTVTLVTRIAGVADSRGPWNVFVNGNLVGIIPVNNGPNNFQEVKTYSFLVPAGDLLALNHIVLGINDPVVNDGYDIDFVSLVGGGAVPEPGVWALMIAGFGLAGSALRRRRAIAA